MADEDTGPDEPASDEGITEPTETDERDEELEALRAKLSTFEKRDGERTRADRDRKQAAKRKERDAAESKGEVSKLLDMTKAELKETSDRAGALESELQTYRTRDKARTLAQQVTAAAGGGNTDAIALMIPGLGLPMDGDIDPTLVKGTLKRLQQLAPALLGAPTPHPNGRPPLRPGINVPNGEQAPTDTNDPAYWRHQGDLASSQSTLPPGYADATGRGKQ